MDWRKEVKIFSWLSGFFIVVYFMPLGIDRFSNALFEALRLLKWYAREHVILCLVPAFFIAGIIAVFINQDAVIKYFGVTAKKWKAYLIASVSGTILAVCSCTILPLFASIHKKGAGLGPAITFLYSGPAINIMAIILTARVLGFELGIARIIGAVIFSIVIGIIMAFLFRKEENEKVKNQPFIQHVASDRPLWKTSFHFFVPVLILLFANWGEPGTSQGLFNFIWLYKWYITGFLGLLFIYSLIIILRIKTTYVSIATITVIIMILITKDPVISFVVAIACLTILLLITPGESQDWLNESWGFAKQILPLLAAGILIAGILLGSTQGEGLIPDKWVSLMVGGNSLLSNFFASVFGAFMYFATLTEVPIIEGLLNNGMGQGPALALLLAGPAISLPNMLVIRGVIGTRKTIVYIILVSFMATISGLIYGAII